LRYSTENIEFLDVCISIPNNEIATDLYRKSSDLCPKIFCKDQLQSVPYLHNKSCHPENTKRAIPCGLGVRDKRICTNNNLYHRKRNDIWMSYGKFDDKGDNPTNNPNIHNVQGNYRLSPGQQQIVACWSATPDNRKSVENPGFFQ
jgi:hypothetical protein